MSAIDQSLKQSQQHRHIVEMQSGGRFIEDQQIAAGITVLSGIRFPLSDFG